MTTISVSELQKVTYLDAAQCVGERAVWLQPLWTGTEWKHWVPAGETVVELQSLGIVDGFYFSAEKQHEHDVALQFFDVLVRYASYRDVSKYLTAIYSDLRVLAGVLWRNDHLFGSVEDASASANLAAADFEQVLATTRSLYDCLQELLRALWRHTKILDPAIQRRKRDLPESFAAVALHGETPRSAADIEAKWALPVVVGEAYARAAVAFAAMRTARDRILHGALDPPFVFRSERGFAVPVEIASVGGVVAFSEESLLPNRLGPLARVFATLVRTCLNACDDLVLSFGRVIGLPPSIAPHHRVFLRGPHLHILNVLDECCRGDGWMRFSQLRLP